MTADPWSVADIPDQRGRRALVTGGIGPLGAATALELARAGATVVVAGRDPVRLEEVVQRFTAQRGLVAVPLQVDLADLSSVRRAAAEAAAGGPLHLLVNNAAARTVSYRRTVDGFELQLGTNHLGQFALTGLLLPHLADGDARVVTVSSVVARTVRTVSLADPREEPRRYRRRHAYAESRLANLLFTVELDRRLRAEGLEVTAVAAHPGYTRGDRPPRSGAIGLAVASLVAQSPAEGAAALLRAATQPGLPGGAYVGPGGPFELHGAPRLVPLPGPAQDPELARGLWELSERATGISFP